MMHSTLKDPKANNHKIDIGLNEDFIEIINCNLEKMAPFMMFFSENNRSIGLLRLLLGSLLSHAFLFICS